MSAKIQHLLAFLAVLICVSVAQAGQLPVDGAYDATATMTADGIPYDVPLFLDGDSGYWEVGYYDDFGNLVEGYTIDRPGEWRCHIEGEIDPDPSVTQVISVTDFGTPSSFSFTMTGPLIPPIGATNTVRASIDGGLTDATGNGVTITPTAAKLQVATLNLPATNAGVDVGLAESYAGTGGLESHSYGAYAAGPIAGPAGTWTGLSTTIAFSLSGGSDTASLTGIAEIVPEPSSFALAGIGALVAFGYAVRRRRASRS